MSDNKVEVQFGATTAELEKAAGVASKAVSDAMNTMRDRMVGVGDAAKVMHLNAAGALDGMRSATEPVTAAFGSLNGAVAAVTAILAGGAVFRSAVNETLKLGSEAKMLAGAFAITATEASVLNIALGDVFLSSDQAAGAASGMARNIKQNEGAMNAMGVVTRGANGELLATQELLRNGAKVVMDHAAGMNQSIAMTQVFGRGMTDVGVAVKLANLDMDAARAKAESLSLTITAENVEANKAFKNSMNDVGDVVTGLKKAIGDALIPVLAKLGEWFSEIGPAAVVTVKGAIGGLVSVFWALKNGVVVLWETLDAMIYSIAEPLLSLGRALYKLVTGDFKGAAEEMTNWPDRIAQRWDAAMKSMVASSEDTMTKIGNLFSDGTEAKGPKGGTRQASVKEGKDDKEQSQMGDFKDALRTRLTEQGQFFAESTGMELAYWQNIKATRTLSVKDAQSVNAEIFNLTRKRLQDEHQEQFSAIDNERALTGERLNVKRAELDALRSAGEISAAEVSRRARQIDQEQFEAERDLLQQKMALYGTTAKERERLEAELAQAEERNNAGIIRNTTATSAAVRKSWQDAFSPISQSFEKAMGGIINGTMTLRGAMKSMLGDIATEYAKLGVKLVAEWAVNEAAKTAASATGATTRGGIEATAAANSVVLWAATAVKNILASAWEAMAGAYKAIVGIPYVGPFMAPVVAGGAFAAVAGFARSVASAEGGYDIPAGINPLTQLHEREMVLPAKHADTIRSLGESGASASEVNVTLNAHPMPGNYFMVHRDQLVKALKSAQRDNAWKPA
jgi:hypothetical protein